MLLSGRGADVRPDAGRNIVLVIKISTSVGKNASAGAVKMDQIRQRRNGEGNPTRQNREKVNDMYYFKVIICK